MRLVGGRGHDSSMIPPTEFILNRCEQVQGIAASRMSAGYAFNILTSKEEQTAQRKMLPRRLMCLLAKTSTDNTLLRKNAPTLSHVRKCSREQFTKQRMLRILRLREMVNGNVYDEPDPLHKPTMDDSFMPFSMSAPTRDSLRSLNIRSWMKSNQMKGLQYDQRFIFERHETLGNDLAAAHFVLYRGGKVLFKGHKDWMQFDENIETNLPSSYDPKYVLIGIDVSGMPLCYDGLDNFQGLSQLRWLSLRQNPIIDDWGLDKISGEFPRLDYLDISQCVNITERGLESLYRMHNLKKLLVTNHYNSGAFELTCYMLEDCIPELSCDIFIPTDKIEEK